MTTVIAYTYEADFHCVHCAKERFAQPSDDPDLHGIPYDATDSEGNNIHPVFSSDEVLVNIYCRDCLDIIAEA